MSPVLSLLLLNRKLTKTAGQIIECFIPKVLIVFPMGYMLVLLKKSSSPCQCGHKAHGPGACELEATTQAGPIRQEISQGMCHCWSLWTEEEKSCYVGNSIKP